MLTGRTFFWIIVALLFIALALIAYASVLPAYTDDALARSISLDKGWRGLSGKEYTLFMANWHLRMEGVSTQKYPILDKGQGLLSLSVSLLIAGLFLKLRKIDDLSKWSTPARRWSFIMIGLLGMALILMGSFERILADVNRGLVPYWADSTVIPLSGTISLMGILGGATVLLGIAQLFRAKLPVSLCLWHKNHIVISRTTLFVYGILWLTYASLLISDIFYGAWISIPGWLIWLYILASSRAAILSWYK
jgi:hypothetical protein